MSDNEVYSVSQLSKLVNVSVRTLHYYDQIGLLSPCRRPDNGFREYRDEDLVKLQQILIYRELDFSIEKIKDILSAEGYDVLASLDAQKALLQKRIEQAQSMLDSLDDAKTRLRGRLNRDVLFRDFPKEKIEHWDRLEQEKYGASLVEEKFKLIGGLSEEKIKFYTDKSEEFYKTYCQLLRQPISSDVVQEKVLEEYKILNSFLYEIHEGFKGISCDGFKMFAARILEDDVSFEIHEHYGEGFAEHLSQAMEYFADNTLKGDETFRTFFYQ